MCLREVSRLLKLEHISKQFDDKVVLDDINVEIGSGEIVSSLGPSGAEDHITEYYFGTHPDGSGKNRVPRSRSEQRANEEAGFNIVFRTMPYSLI